MAVRFAIVGAGGIARLHAAVIAGLPARLVAVADRNPGKAAGLGGAPRGGGGGGAAARDAGTHVMGEKPVDVTLAAARRIADAERRAGRTVTVISQHRFDPA